MDINTIAFALMASITALFLAATLARETDIHLPAMTQSGDTSVGRRSVNWLAAIAMTAAVLICLI